MSERRDKSLDVFKGLLVAAMVYCHILQFFGETFLFPAVVPLQNAINLLVFPSFVFAFGCSVSIAYLTKPFTEVWGRMLKAALRALGAFYLSGIAFRVLRENKPFASRTVMNILLLQDIPGWSEFLPAFALYGLLSMALFVPLRRLRTRPIWAAGVGAVCLLSCFLPYEHIQSTYLGLLIGTRSHITFPVLQYAPYFVLGIAFPSRAKKQSWIWVACAALCTAAGAFIAWRQGAIPERFPPSLAWVALPAAGTAALLLLAKALSKIPPIKRGRVDPLVPIEGMGRNSLYYLLASNLVLFTCAGRNILPQLKRGGGLWGQPIQSPFGALCWTVVLLLACGFCAWLVSSRRPSKK